MPGPARLATSLDPEGRARGNDVRLTIDLHIQHVAEEALMKMLNETEAKSASAVVLDVDTAEVLAMATVPASIDIFPHRLRPRDATARWWIFRAGFNVNLCGGGRVG